MTNPRASNNQSPPAVSTHADPRLLQRRARRALWFGFKMIAGFIWWELLLARVIGRERVERTRIPRFVKLARSFRALALDLGGVWIKLGQFLSSRVDIIPQPVIAELSGLQDAVPAEPYETIAGIIEAELSRPVDAVFDDLEREPVAAASFGQAHRAQLRPQSGAQSAGDNGRAIRVVVKVQRPFLDEIVNVDLRSLKTIARWLKFYEPIRRRANLDALIREFADGVLDELDYEQEARNAELFARNFAGDSQVRVPKPYHEYTTRRVLVLENVEDIKITDFDGLESAGVSRKAVARRLFSTYLQQIFIDGFFHADPHPGNLFVQPLDVDMARRLNVPVEDAPQPDARPPTPFRLTYVDFGMVGRVTPEYMQELKEFIIAVSLKDARRLTAAAKRMGFFLPGADTSRIEQAIGLLFDRFWGMTVTDLKDVEFDEMYTFAVEFRDLLSSLPFQIPQNILYLGRAVNILSGMSTALDPEFNAWKEIQPFAEGIVSRQGQRSAQDVIAEALKLLRLTVQLPVQADTFLSRALAGQLEIRAQLSESSTGDLRRIESSLARLTWALMFVALLICATLLLINGVSLAGAVCLAGAFLTLLRTLLR